MQVKRVTEITKDSQVTFPKSAKVLHGFPQPLDGAAPSNWQNRTTMIRTSQSGNSNPFTT